MTLLHPFPSIIFPDMKSEAYLQCGSSPSGLRRWHYCRPLCPPAELGEASAHPVEVHSSAHGHSSECRLHTGLQQPERWCLNPPMADSVRAFLCSQDILWSVWSAALGLTEPAAGGAAAGCWKKEASYSEVGPLIDNNSPVCQISYPDSVCSTLVKFHWLKSACVWRVI